MNVEIVERVYGLFFFLILITVYLPCTCNCTLYYLKLPKYQEIPPVLNHLVRVLIFCNSPILHRQFSIANSPNTIISHFNHFYVCIRDIPVQDTVHMTYCLWSVWSVWYMCSIFLCIDHDCIFCALRIW